jgi:uncharacterized protein (TIGR03435 family)
MSQVAMEDDLHPGLDKFFGGPMRVALRIAAVAVYGVTSAFGQSAKPLEFEVASVKTNKTGQREGGITAIGGGRFRATNIPLKILLATAYDVNFEQISGGPDWLDSERYDVEAKPDRLATTKQIHLMLQKLLAERFGLVLRREIKEMPIFALVLDKGISKIRVHDGPEVDFGIRPGDKGQVVFRGVSLPRFSLFLSMRLRRTVVDKTGLPGVYDFELAWAPDEPQRDDGPESPPQPDPSGASIFTAVREQLGLKLVSEKGPVEFLNITHVERPSAN